MPQRPFSSRARQALALADQNASRPGVEFIGTEHLLLGLLEEESGPAAQILNHLGVTVERVKSAWREATGSEL